MVIGMIPFDLLCYMEVAQIGTCVVRSQLETTDTHPLALTASKSSFPEMNLFWNLISAAASSKLNDQPIRDIKESTL